MKRDTPPLAVTHDQLLGGKVQFDQPADGYRAAIDPVFLAASIPVLPGQSVLELGSGAGAATLCLAKRVPGCSVLGVERDAELVAIANANAEVNDLADRVRFVVGDILEPLPDIASVSFDHAMANPPFLETTRADMRMERPSRLRDATVETSASLEDWVRVLCGSVRRKGRVTLIHRADRLDDMLLALSALAGDVAVLPLWSKAGREARRVIVSGRPATAAPLRLLNGIVLHEENGEFSAAAKAILNDAAALEL